MCQNIQRMRTTFEQKWNRDLVTFLNYFCTTGTSIVLLAGAQTSLVVLSVHVESIISHHSIPPFFVQSSIGAALVFIGFCVVASQCRASATCPRALKTRFPLQSPPCVPVRTTSQRHMALPSMFMKCLVLPAVSVHPHFRSASR
jgi:hypothetical protein